MLRVQKEALTHSLCDTRHKMAASLLERTNRQLRREFRQVGSFGSHIGRQVEALMSQYSSLQLHKRAIERHLASLAAQIHEPDVILPLFDDYLVLVPLAINT
jgi:Glu-tRNA(Gln) amidotransferase subunit E-like FAD-binding protein